MYDVVSRAKSKIKANNCSRPLARSFLPLPQILLVTRGGSIATAAGYLQWSLPVVIPHCCPSIVVFLVASHFQVTNCSGTVVVRKVPINLQCRGRQFQSAGGLFIVKVLSIVLPHYSH